ncbi:hypothetical protein BS78_05G268700 [Paspalum vaginatum]|nr:hypothetical protein BS78_05G268700 [Paspalum vaginatum]
MHVVRRVSAPLLLRLPGNCHFEGAQEAMSSPWPSTVLVPRNTGAKAKISILGSASSSGIRLGTLAVRGGSSPRQYKEVEEAVKNAARDLYDEAVNSILMLKEGVLCMLMLDTPNNYL